MITDDLVWKLYQRLGMSLHNCVIAERSMVLLIASLKSFGGDNPTPASVRNNQMERIRWLFGQTAGQLKTEMSMHFAVSEETISAISLLVQYRNELVHNVPIDLPQEGDPDHKAIEFYQYCELVDAATFSAMGALANVKPKKQRDAAAQGVMAMREFLRGTESIAKETDIPPPREFIPFNLFSGI